MATRGFPALKLLHRVPSRWEQGEEEAALVAQEEEAARPAFMWRGGHPEGSTTTRETIISFAKGLALGTSINATLSLLTGIGPIGGESRTLDNHPSPQPKETSRHVNTHRSWTREYFNSTQGANQTFAIRFGIETLVPLGLTSIRSAIAH